MRRVVPPPRAPRVVPRELRVNRGRFLLHQVGAPTAAFGLVVIVVRLVRGDSFLGSAITTLLFALVMFLLWKDSDHRGHLRHVDDHVVGYGKRNKPVNLPLRYLSIQPSLHPFRRFDGELRLVAPRTDPITINERWYEPGELRTRLDQWGRLGLEPNAQPETPSYSPNE